MKPISNKTYREAQLWASSFLKAYGKEAAIAYHLLLDMKRWQAHDWFINQNKTMPQHEKDQYKQMIGNIIEKNRPFQYELGYTWFYDRYFMVNEATLIPRSETEILLCQVIDCVKKRGAKKNLRILDIGTGTGILAILLKKEFPEAEVFASDISKEALQIASANAKIHRADIQFVEGDLLEPFKGQKFDIILSNPPYIGLDETDQMDESVLKYEPKMALFAGKSGLHIYERLLPQLTEYINRPGYVYVEIGFQQATKIIRLIKYHHIDAHVEVYKDFSEKDRVISLAFR